ncbi:hypothetical protein ERO13_D05G375550v2 [Gossypium hirsutum]|nr:hypothetical protein ERO13_D05G375550v2 [Gossypium hirsutum]
MASYLFLCLFLFFPHLYASFSSSGSHSCSSLIQFKDSFSINQTEDAYLSCGSKSYPKTNSWKEGTDCCSWDGVTCDHLNAHVIALDLSCSWLYGNFPSNTTLFLLPHLQKLNLAYNDFNLSKIPSEFGRFTSLFYLNLSNTGFPFTIDKHALEGLVHNLTEVRHLFLDGMNMSLSLAGCDLQGKFPKNILDLPNLNLLNLGGNQNLNLDPLKFNRSSNLEHLDLSSMSFSTESIDSVDNLQALKYLDLSDSNISGTVPISLGNLLQLTHLDLSWNQLSGQIPLSILNLTQLEYLRIAKSSLEGSIPDEVTAFPNLIYLGLYDNLLNGTLPSWLYTAPSLKRISLSQNQFSGHIKEFQSKSLEVISLENNKLQGPLPSSIFQLLNLTHLVLSSNNLSGVIEFRMFSNLPNLKYLHLSYNSLSLTSNSTSSIPQWMQEVGNVSLTYLNVSHNSLTEVEHFPWKNIEFLDLSSNLISGNLPIPASTINVFLISNNSFNGEVSSLICNASSLRILDLSHNNSSGTIPQCFGNLSNSLEFLNLKKSKFYGTIPPTFAKGCQLMLDLGNNKINDTFPHWLGSLPQLQVLVLKSNHMHGSLCVNSSKSSPFFSKIKIFDLSSNYFTGPLPVRYINSFKAMINLEKIGITLSYMGVYNRNAIGFYTYSIGIVMKGQDMELVKIFTMWMIIDLSNNQFEGVFQSLEWLDLSSNRLSGTIPNRLADLSFLSSFNVSENKLHGQIPQGKQFNTFGNDSYQGNRGLCGFPVSKGCNIIEPAPPNVLEKDGSKSNITFGWKVVLIGYGCGVVFGMSVGYVVFKTGKPKWLVNLVEIQHEKKRRRKSKEGSHSNGRRRI